MKRNQRLTGKSFNFFLHFDVFSTIDMQKRLLNNEFATFFDIKNRKTVNKSALLVKKAPANGVTAGR